MALAPTKKGITTITWGTANRISGTANANNLSSALVESITIREKDSPIEIEGNEGFTAAVVLLSGQFDATITVVHEASANRGLPAPGDTIVLSLPVVGNNNTAGTSNFNAVVTSCLPVNLGRKQEGKVEIQAIVRPDALA